MSESRFYKALGCVFLTQIVIGVIVYFAAVGYSGEHSAAEAETIYSTQVTSCEQGNALRESVVLAIETAALTSQDPAARIKYREALNKQLAQPFIREDGSKECRRAVPHP